MPRTSRRHLLTSISVALAILAGCAAPAAPPASGKKPASSRGGGQDAAAGGTPVTTAGSPAAAGAAAAASPAPGAPAIDAEKFLLGRVFVPLGIVSNNGGAVIGQNTANVIGQNTANIVSNNGGSMVATGGLNVIGQNTANVIGQNTANVIGQNTANVIGQNTANIVSNNGGSVIGQNTANIVSNNGGSLGQRPLAYAALRVVDAAGKPKKGKNGQPLVGQADAWGQFLVPKEEIDANCVIEVESPAITGQLKAFVAKGAQTTEKELEVDMVSTLATTYILDKFVKGDQGVFERLTPDIEAEARGDVREAIGENADKVLVTTEVSAVVAVVDGLIGKDVAVQDVFKRIEKLLIVFGIQNDGDGMAALEVPLESVDGLLPTAGGVYIFTAADHRLRRVDIEGKIWNVVQPNTWPYTEVRPTALKSYNAGLAIHDGWLYLSDTYNHRVVRIKNGVVDVLAGTGTVGSAEEGVDARSASVSFPTGLAISSEGEVYFAEAEANLIRRITVEGKLEKVVGGGSSFLARSSIHPFSVALQSPQGLAFNNSGELIIADRNNDVIRKYSVNENAVIDLIDQYSVVTPISVSIDGSRVFVAGGGNQPLFEVTDGAVSSISYPGTGQIEQSRRLSSPKAMGVLGEKLFVQQANGLVVEFGFQFGNLIHDVAGRLNSGGAVLTKAVRMAINSRASAVG